MVTNPHRVIYLLWSLILIVERRFASIHNVHQLEDKFRDSPQRAGEPHLKLTVPVCRTQHVRSHSFIVTLFTHIVFIIHTCHTYTHKTQHKTTHVLCACVRVGLMLAAVRPRLQSVRRTHFSRRLSPADHALIRRTCALSHSYLHFL